MKNHLTNAEEWGRWSFITGLVLAILAGFIQVSWLPIVLFTLGLIVGFLNISGEQGPNFLIATIALLLIGMSGLQISAIGQQVSTIINLMLNNFVSFVAAAGLVVAIKLILVATRPERIDRS